MRSKSRKYKDYVCHTCDLKFSSRREREGHENVVHGYSVEVYFCSKDEYMMDTMRMKEEQKNGQTVIVDSVQGKLICPKCSDESADEDSFSRHLNFTHKAYCERIYPEIRKHEHTKTDNMDDDSKGCLVNTHRILAYSFPSPKSSSSVPSTKPTKPTCDYNTSILMASEAMDLPKSEQKKILLICELGGWKPIIYTPKDGNQCHVLTSQKSIDTFLAKESGLWMLPTPNDDS